MATNKNITMRQFNGVDYDTLYPKTIAAQIDDVYDKDEMSNLFLPKAGGSMGGILDMNGNRITNLASPVNDGDVATKGYVDGIGEIFERISGDRMICVSSVTHLSGQSKSFNLSNYFSSINSVICTPSCNSYPGYDYAASISGTTVTLHTNTGSADLFFAVFGIKK